ncbi:MAG TPA: IPExxxVDY family protein [Flavobacteriales bacterium]|nr:IPExxxVDY family protein [Flavobacteriales bacterium]|tara:strand:+ start:4247 stop:4669 length:423 start_codon:yes stop_codon:yes gene_type:complete
MAKFTLDWSEEELLDFLLIGIASHSKDYKLCYEINKSLNFDFYRTADDYTLTIKGKTDHFPMYTFADDENLLDFYLLGNKGKQGFLVKEFKNFDYLLMIKGNIDFVDIDEYVDKLRSLNNVLTALPINVEELKSKDYLIF